VFESGMVITIQPQLTTLDRRIGLQFGETVVIHPWRRATAPLPAPHVIIPLA